MTAEAIKTIKLSLGHGCALGVKTASCHCTASIALAMALLCLVASPVVALDHSGTIASNETWYAADNPHVIVTSVTVSDGVILTIEDGADVLLNSGTRLNVYGTLTAVGSPGGGILFSRNTTSNGTGLRFLGDGTGTLDPVLV